MKLQLISALLLTISGAEAFAPVGRFGTAATSRTARSFGLDPSSFQDLSQHVSFQDLHQQVDSFRDAFTSLTLSDVVDVDPSSVMDAADTATVGASTAAQSGWFGFLTAPIEGLLVLIHSGMVAMGMTSNAWGLSIIILTLVVKAVTFPLTKTQLESTNKMQALQPTIKELQARYQSNPEVMNQKIAEVYQTNEVNPLAGCLPSLAQIPVFIGLYRSVLNLAAADKLDEPFLFLPSLEGPTYGADPTHGSDWILSGWQNGAPSMGWENTLPFLVLPIFLVISQFASMQLMQPKNQDPEQQQANIILKVLPLMIGWFSLNVPSALCIYWVVNNIVTTASTLIIRNAMDEPVVVSGGGAATTAAASPRSSPFAPPPMRDKPAGFGSTIDDSEVKPLTPIDAEIVNVAVAEDMKKEDAGTGMASTPSPSSKTKRGKKKKRRN